MPFFASRFLHPRRAVLLTAALAGLAVPAIVTPAHAADIAWANGYPEATAKAKPSGKLIMVDMYTDWCVWCKRLDKDTYPDPKVVAIANEKLVSVKVNAEKEGVALAKKFNVHGYPTILFIDPKTGEQVARIVGYAPGPVFADKVTDILTAYHDLPVIEAKATTTPQDAHLQGKLVRLYATRGETVKAEAAFAHVTSLDASDAQGELAKSANTLGDLYQEKEDFTKAIPLFRIAADKGQSSDAVGYARTSIAQCYLSQQDLVHAEAELKATVSDPKVSAKDKEDAQKTLASIAAFRKRQAGGTGKK